VTRGEEIGRMEGEKEGRRGVRRKEEGGRGERE